MRVYHLMPAEWGLAAVRNRRLKVARFADLNDPFELLGADLADRGHRFAFRQWKEQMNDRFGVLCFSDSWRSSLLWSHYGDKHHGLCLGFDLPDEKAVKVRYRKSRLAVAEDELDEANAMQFLSTKSGEWEYERETRVLVHLDEPDPSDGNYFANFGNEGDDLVLREIIVGSLAPVTRSELENELEKAGLASASVALLKARLAFKSYSIVRDRRGLQ
ncbi:DUF2971 domain-containing protein [Qipengyuania sp. SM2507]